MESKALRFLGDLIEQALADLRILLRQDDRRRIALQFKAESFEVIEFYASELGHE